MHGNPLYHWIALAAAGVLMLLPAIAILRGWVPPWMRRRYTGGLRSRAYALLCLFGGMVANGVPRLANASYDVVMVAGLVGIGFYGLAAVLFVLSAIKDSRASD